MTASTARLRPMRWGRRGVRGAAVVLVVVALLTAACSGGSSRAGSPATDSPSSDPASTEPPAVYQGPAGADRPNIVFVLMDDASTDLIKTMRSARYMKRHGATYQNAFVVDSLCCPSRAATLAGQYPHQNGVLINAHNEPNDLGPMGGWKAFVEHGSEQRTFALRLQQSGYTTGLVGKYLNGYLTSMQGKPTGTEVDGVPPGWTEFRTVLGSAYDGWKFEATEPQPDGSYQLRSYPAPQVSNRKVRDAAYAGTVVEDLSLQFIRDHRDDAKPYFLFVNPYATHDRITDNNAYPDEPLFPAAFGDRPSKRRPHGNCGLLDCRRLTTEDIPGYGDPRWDNRPLRANGNPAPDWNAHPADLTRKQAQTYLRDRARMVQSVDRMMRRILDLVDDNTYVVLTSDNGQHLGQYGLTVGKGTPYDADIRVPLLVVGPGVVPGPRKAVVSNIDWAPTIERLAGVDVPAYRSGRSMVPSFAKPGADLQAYTFVEHTFARTKPGADPDKAYDGGGLNVIPSYLAVRSRHALLVRFDLDRRWGSASYAYEFYDLKSQRYEAVNQFDEPEYAGQVAELMAKLEQFDACSVAREDAPVTGECRRLTRQD